MSTPPHYPGNEQLQARYEQNLRRGDEAGAEHAARQLAERDAASDAMLAFVTARQLERGDAGAARDFAERALRRFPTSGVLLYQCGAALEALQDHAAARDAFAAAYRADPRLLLAQLACGAQEGLLGHRDAMLRCYVPALELAQRGGLIEALPQLPADYRHRLEPAIGTVIDARAAAYETALAPLRDSHGSRSMVRVDAAAQIRLGQKPARWAHPQQRPNLLYVPDLPPRPWFEREEFPFLQALESQTGAIHAELLALLGADPDLEPYIDMPEDAPAAPIWRGLNRSPQWSAFHLWRDGERLAANAAQCPVTTAALEALPLMRIAGHAPEALFSILQPGTRIPPHTGVVNGRVTVHLPLVVPPDCGALRVGGQARAWTPGRCLAFDDSFVHEAWNDSGETRVVLIFDVWDPRLSEPERRGIAALIEAMGEFNHRYATDLR